MPEPSATAAQTEDESGKSAYDLGLSDRRQRINILIASAGLVVSLLLGFFVSPPTLWGVLPVGLYAILCLLGMDIVVATVVATTAGLLIAQLPPVEVGALLGDAIGDLITKIGFIIVLGAGTAEVLRITGVAERTVRGIMRLTGGRNQRTVIMGVMLACLVLVTSLGTLAGAIAIASPIIVPLAARAGFTRSATAAMLFVGGCAGLALAPFAGSNVAILTAAEVDYWTYVQVGAGPLAALSLVLGVVVIPWIQRRSLREGGDAYSAEDAVESEQAEPSGAARATLVFFVLLAVSVVYATTEQAGISFPLLTLPLLGVATGLAGGKSVGEITNAMYRGGTKLFSMLLLFWLLAALFLTQELLEPYTVIMESYGDELRDLSAMPFALGIGVLGWVGVPGATAAQVTLLDEVFGQLAGHIGIGAGAWVIVLLWASKGDTYGPWPNGNMIGVMGMARSNNLRNQLLTGWTIMAAACVMYVAILALLL